MLKIVFNIKIVFNTKFVFKHEKVFDTLFLSLILISLGGN
jgi:hypothetical protein